MDNINRFFVNVYDDIPDNASCDECDCFSCDGSCHCECDGSGDPCNWG